MALFYAGGASSILFGWWFLVRAARGSVRIAELPGLFKLTTSLIVFGGAVSAFGMGLTVVSLDSVPLVPLGLGFMLLGLWVATYGARLLRMPTETDIRAQFKRLTSRTLLLGQIVAFVGLVPVLGAYFYLTGQRVVGLVLIGGGTAVLGLLFERLSDSLLWRPLIPTAFYRLLTFVGVILTFIAIVVSLGR